jgi:predicted ribosomally synthesized peptide with SipW-like signal peptide
VRRRILFGVITIVALVAIVAGATYAVFSDQVMSDIQTFSAGTVDIDVNGQDHMFVTTFDLTDMEPGESSSQVITINNTGSLAVNYEVYVDYGYDPDDLFHCDGANSLQAWASPNTGGPIASEGNASVTLQALLPLAAGNNCQDKSGKLRVTVHAVQASELDGFICMKLVYKDEYSDPPWIPYGDSDSQYWDPPDHRWMPNPVGSPPVGQHGNLCYKVESGQLHVVVNAYGLTPSAYYQLSLNGPGGCSTFEDTTFATMTGDLYHSGWWVGPPDYLASSCGGVDWHEGVYNFYGTDGELQADGLGNISLDYTIGSEVGTDPLKPPLPNGTYNNVKFIVKEIHGYSGSAPSHTDHGNAWWPLLMEIRQLNFQIP